MGKDLRRSLEGEGAGTSRFHLSTETVSRDNAVSS